MVKFAWQKISNDYTARQGLLRTGDHSKTSPLIVAKQTAHTQANQSALHVLFTPYLHIHPDIHPTFIFTMEKYSRRKVGKRRFTVAGRTTGNTQQYSAWLCWPQLDRCASVASVVHAFFYYKCNMMLVNTSLTLFNILYWGVSATVSPKFNLEQQTLGRDCTSITLKDH